MQQISANLYRFESTCHVYVIRNGNEAILIDFGDGAVLGVLADLGVTHVSAILMTHYHRDQGQGLPIAVQAGIPIWVPYTEQDMFAQVDTHWQTRSIYNNYDNRQDRFSLLDPVPVSGLLCDYKSVDLVGIRFRVLPTPGHTLGSVSLLAQIDNQLVAFTGDLIAGPGKAWSLAAMQWSYNGVEGAALSVPSLVSIKNEQPALLLPSHGEPISNPAESIDLLVERLWRLLQDRGQNPRLMKFIDHPYDALTPHLLWNRTSMANSYVLLSDNHHALFIDFGYDFMAGIAPGADRASRRPWLYTLPGLKRDFGVTQIDAVILTHYHDDHVAGCNLLREVEGAQVWAALSFTDVLNRPNVYDLPCLWYDPIHVDHILPLEQPIRWQDYTLTLYPLPGHTRYAVAISFEVDGRRVLATGDQYQGADGQQWNYVYNNRFHMSDYRKSAALYRQLMPDLILPGHWTPADVGPKYFDELEVRAAVLEQHHQALLPLDCYDLGGEDRAANIRPYQITTQNGGRFSVEVEVQNPLPDGAQAALRMITPPGWEVDPDLQMVYLDRSSSTKLCFHITVPVVSLPARRLRIAADLTIGERRLGQVAEALVTING